MTALVIISIVLLLFIILVQLGKVTELSAKIRGEQDAEEQGNNRTAVWLMIFMVAFLVFCVVSAYYYKNSMLGYGPLTSASEHGWKLDGLFNTTLFFTGIVFVLTQIMLFYYSYKYRHSRDRVGEFVSHNNTIEVVWTAIPALVMTFLVVQGLIVWNDVMPDVDPTEDVIEIEATGYQFAWDIRYPGQDGKIGTKNYKLIDPGLNPLGLDFTDPKTHDDFIADRIVLPVGKKVRVRITSKDVLHNFYLPHFRVKMDAIPGLPTYFIFTPTITTADYRQQLREYPEWNVEQDPEDPELGTRWENFDFELACAELCGSGHYSMRKVVEIVSQEEYDAWFASQNSFYFSGPRNSDIDPNKGKLLDVDIVNRAREFSTKIEEALNAENEADKVVRLDYVKFVTGSAELTPDSKYELDNVIEVMKDRPELVIEVAGHTDNTGDAQANLALSTARANAVRDYLINDGIAAERLNARGYGQTEPVADNETEEGRQQNRRTEFKIISQ
ncbi:OmpA family protein [Portibacter marinus]|uniref:OmpA family protein n=1 Tax=Portibacter marinus TaxID=2898660 RepID=UPI001F2EA11D|nr:OmpA family protein [Portibacter marinus]